MSVDWWIDLFYQFSLGKLALNSALNFILKFTSFVSL